MNIKLLLIVVAVLISFPVFAQNSVFLKGRITGDSLQESSVHIINLTQRTGTVNTSAGTFQIEVKENDVLLFSSIEYEKKEITVSPEIFKLNNLEVNLVRAVNVLDDVNLSNITLTGNLNTDLENIETVKGLPVGFAVDFMNAKFKSDFTDPLRDPEQLAFQQNNVMQETPVNLIAVAGLITDLLGIKKPKKIKLPPGFNKPVSVQVRNLFNDDFFITSLKIEEARIKEFLYFLDDQAIDKQLLLDVNRMALIELLIDQSERYRQLYSDN